MNLFSKILKLTVDTVPLTRKVLIEKVYVEFDFQNTTEWSGQEYYNFDISENCFKIFKNDCVEQYFKKCNKYSLNGKPLKAFALLDFGKTKIVDFIIKE